jgi:metallo-beta-lactamase class B
MFQCPLKPFITHDYGSYRRGYALATPENGFSPTIYYSGTKPRIRLFEYRSVANLEFMAKKMLLAVILRALLALSFAASAEAQAGNAEYLEPFPAHHVIDNVYFVGSKSLGIYLVTTPKGHILINAGLEESVPGIQRSVETLGFRFSDIKILLISHAHFDHDAGAARIKQLTGARYMVMDADVPVVESGGKEDFFYGNRADMLYPPTKVDRVLHDGDTVKLGDTVLTAHLTPGHTKGCTTWTLKVKDAGKIYDVVIVGSPNVNDGYQLVNNAAYPQIGSDYEIGFRVLRSLHCDVFLGAHGNYYDMEAKYARLKKGGMNPFIDPDGYKQYVDERQQAFRAELARQKGKAN